MPQMTLNSKRMTQNKLIQEDATNETEMITDSVLMCNEQLWTMDAMNSTGL